MDGRTFTRLRGCPLCDELTRSSPIISFRTKQHGNFYCEKILPMKPEATEPSHPKAYQISAGPNHFDVTFGLLLKVAHTIFPVPSVVSTEAKSDTLPSSGASASGLKDLW